MPKSNFSSANALEALHNRYRGTKWNPLSFATVRDYCDSVDQLSELAAISGDLKDVQRPWMIKAILANVPRGARLLEIGAGEPLVAHILTRLGYEVTVVDPYDGSGNGPLDVARFKSEFDPVSFVVDRFGAHLELAGKWDCFYSISVLEHVPLEHIPSVFEGMMKFGGRDVWSIHAIDHVLQGAGERHHEAMLNVVAQQSGIGMDYLSTILDQARSDTDTYFLSAEGHNRWRGQTPYEEFPMRRCISVQFVSTLSGRN